MKVVCCICGLLRCEDEPCLICEGDDFDSDENFDAFMAEGLRAEAGDVDDTRRLQCERRLLEQETRH